MITRNINLKDLLLFIVSFNQYKTETCSFGGFASIQAWFLSGYAIRSAWTKDIYTLSNGTRLRLRLRKLINWCVYKVKNLKNLSYNLHSYKKHRKGLILNSTIQNSRHRFGIHLSDLARKSTRMPSMRGSPPRTYFEKKGNIPEPPST